MPNYRYRIDGEDVILSKQEHDQVQEGIRSKAGLITLRSGKLGINPIFIRKYSETQIDTDVQAEGRKQILALEEKNNYNPTPEDRERRRKLNKMFLDKFKMNLK